MEQTLLQVDHLTIGIDKDHHSLTAVEDVSFALPRGGSLGLVGESGCGKSITCLAITRLAAPNIQIAGGSARFEGTELADLSDKELAEMRGKAFSMIFQDSISGLNPLLKVGRQVSEALEIQLGMKGEAAKKQALALLGQVHLDHPEIAFGKYPHELSGGQRQRVMIAMAIAARPRLLIADEPTTALDVTTQAQILSLLAELRQTTGMGLILISHDVGVIREMCDEVLVMYAGQTVEYGDARAVLKFPLHPYTQALARSVSCARYKGEALHVIPGTVASLEQRQGVTGCLFADRCEVRCARWREPVPLTLMPDGRSVRCHRREAGYEE